MTGGITQHSAANTPCCGNFQGRHPCASHHGAYSADLRCADAFGATKTPDVFLFNGNLELTYKGAIDDNMKQKDSVKEPYLKNALEAMVAGKPINPGETKAIGCSIKRVS